jgi:hypothetical protein
LNLPISIEIVIVAVEMAMVSLNFSGRAVVELILPCRIHSLVALRPLTPGVGSVVRFPCL